MDIAKGLLDHGIHPPTMYFPLIVHEALMICSTARFRWGSVQSVRTTRSRSSIGRITQDGIPRRAHLVQPADGGLYRGVELEAGGAFLARRLSGGGAVFHDLGNLNFTFLVQKPHYNLDRQLGVIVEACRLLGIPAERSGRNDVLTGDRKFSGNAFYARQGR